MHAPDIEAVAHVVLLVPPRHEVREADGLIDRLAGRGVGKTRKVADAEAIGRPL
jgi:hypothetical protein